MSILIVLWNILGFVSAIYEQEFTSFTIWMLLFFYNLNAFVSISYLLWLELLALYWKEGWVSKCLGLSSHLREKALRLATLSTMLAVVFSHVVFIIYVVSLCPYFAECFHHESVDFCQILSLCTSLDYYAVLSFILSM